MKTDPSNDTCTLCRTLIEEEGYGPLCAIGERSGIDAVLMVRLCDAAADLAQYRREGRPLGMVLLVGDRARLEDNLPASPFSLRDNLTLGNFRREIRLLGGLVDGCHLALALDRTGKIVGIRRVHERALDARYQEADRDVDPLLSDRYRHVAILSRLVDGLAFYVPPEGNRVKLFDRGDLVAHYSMGDWHPTDYRGFLRALLQRAQELYAGVEGSTPFETSQYRDALLKMTRVAVTMSERGHGTIVSVDLALKSGRRKTTKLSDVINLSRAEAIAVTGLEDEELVNLASLDGAVLVDGRGRLLEVNAILRSDGRAETELHHGSRHEAAIGYSAGRPAAIVLVVSQDGGIGAYCRGKRIAEVPVG